METLYESKYKTTYYEPELSLITNIWTPEDMVDEKFQEEILGWVELVEKYKPKFLIADTSNFGYAVGIEMQEWTNTQVFPRLIAAGVKKFAIVESKEMLAQLSLEQTMEEEDTGAFMHKFFSSIDEAKEWLK